MAGEKWDLPQDARQQGEKYPNYNVHRTPSGHALILDDSKGGESITFRHRSGSMFQFQPDGSAVFRNEKNKFEMTYGDNKVMITGSHDITVNGAKSMKVQGDYDCTVNGNYKMAIKGNMEMLVNGNYNQVIKGKKDVAINGSETVKVKGNYEHTSEGKTYIGSHSKLKIESTGDMLHMIASNDVNIKGKNAQIQATTNIGLKAGAQVVAEAPKFGAKTAEPPKNNMSTEWEQNDPGSAGNAAEN